MQQTVNSTSTNSEPGAERHGKNLRSPFRHTPFIRYQAMSQDAGWSGI
jgi:hypothetical protein